MRANYVYIGGGDAPASAEQLSDAANALYPAGHGPFVPEMFQGTKARQNGEGHGDCDDGCHSQLLPLGHPDVRSGHKRYMQCRKCGAWSHL